MAPMTWTEFRSKHMKAELMKAKKAILMKKGTKQLTPEDRRKAFGMVSPIVGKMWKAHKKSNPVAVAKKSKKSSKKGKKKGKNTNVFEEEEEEEEVMEGKYATGKNAQMVCDGNVCRLVPSVSTKKVSRMGEEDKKMKMGALCKGNLEKSRAQTACMKKEVAKLASKQKEKKSARADCKSEMTVEVSCNNKKGKGRRPSAAPQESKITTFLNSQAAKESLKRTMALGEKELAKMKASKSKGSMLSPKASYSKEEDVYSSEEDDDVSSSISSETESESEEDEDDYDSDSEEESDLDIDSDSEESSSSSEESEQPPPLEE